MCGLFGIISSESTAFKSAPKFIKDAFIAGSVRGTDSCGIMQVNAAGGIESHKQLGNGVNFVESEVSQAIIEGSETAWATFGHNRSATTGGIKGSAAHPFVFYNDSDEPYFAGMHNGTISGWVSTKHVSDTHWALGEIAKHGKDAFNKLTGTYVFIWIDHEEDPEKIHIARNKDRPIHMAFVKGGKNVLFASEAGMLYWLAERNNIEIEEDTVFLLEEEHIYSFSIKNPQAYTKEKIVKTHTTATTSTTRTVEQGGVTNWDRTRREDLSRAVRRILSDAAVTRLNDMSNGMIIPPADAVETPPFDLTPDDPQLRNNEIAKKAREQIENARDLGYLGEMFDFEPIEYSKDECVMYGVCYKSDNPALDPNNKPILIDAKISGITDSMHQRMMNATRIQGRCMRVILDDQGAAGPEVVIRKPLELTTLDKSKEVIQLNLEASRTARDQEIART